MENRIGGRHTSPRHNRASEAVARQKRFCSNRSRVIGAGDGWSPEPGGSSILMTKGVSFMS